MPAPSDESERRLLQVTWDLFFAEGRWPTFAQVDRRLDRDFGVDAQAVGQNLPPHLMYPRLDLLPRPEQPLSLTVAGIAASQGSEEDQKYFLKVISYATKVEQAWSGPPVDESDDPSLTASSVRRDVAMPSAGRDALIGRLGQLLAVEPWGWTGASADGTDWRFVIGRGVRRYRGVTDLEQYWAARTRETADVRPTGQEIGETPMASAAKLFISHAFSDRKLADLFRDTLVLGGIPAERIFYSSGRPTGIPSGRDVRSHLREELQGAALVIELISRAFLASPMCLIELGGAWAMEKSTFPVVIPPLERSEATSQVGDVHMGVLGSDSDIDDVFAELPDTLSAELGLALKNAAWQSAVRQFRQRLPSALVVTSQAAAAPSPANAKPVGTLRGISLANWGVVGRGVNAELHGEATNNDEVERTAVLKATFYGVDKAIVGTAEGLVSQIAPGETKTFTLRSLEGIPEHTRLKVQVDTVL